MNNLIFSDLPDYKVATVEYPKLDYVYNGIQENIEKVLRYERRNSKVAESDHPLLGMLNVVSRELDSDIRFHYLAALDLNDEWCAARGITTASKTCKPHLGVYLGGGDIEFVVSSIDRMATDKFVNNTYPDWDKLTPVKVVCSNYTDSYPWIPGEAPEHGNGWAMLTVDLPMLSIMYREWVKFNRKNKIEETRSAFIRNYVLVNAIQSHQYTKQLNRLTNIKQGKDVDHVRGNKEVATVDYEARLVREQYRMIKDNALRDLNWVELLHNTSLDKDVTLFDRLEPIQAAETSQNRWALALAQLPILRFLLLHDRTDGVNQQYRARLKRFLHEFKRDRGMYGLKNYTAIDMIQEEFERLLHLSQER